MKRSFRTAGEVAAEYYRIYNFRKEVIFEAEKRWYKNLESTGGLAWGEEGRNPILMECDPGESFSVGPIGRGHPEALLLRCYTKKQLVRRLPTADQEEAEITSRILKGDLSLIPQRQDLLLRYRDLERRRKVVQEREAWFRTRLELLVTGRTVRQANILHVRIGKYSFYFNGKNRPHDLIPPEEVMEGYISEDLLVHEPPRYVNERNPIWTS